MKTIRRSFLAAGAAALPTLGHTMGKKPEKPVRALWVTRFDYRTADDVRRICANSAALGFTDLFFQIRGHGTVYYRSRFEPWAHELSGSDAGLTGRNPGWDPLALATETGHRAGLRIHAYANVLPGWRGRQNPPAASGQLWASHRDWFMVDRLRHRMQPPSKWYTFLIPSHPAVRQHIAQLFTEMSRYPVDGIHLDYIRFPEDYHTVNHEFFPKASKEERLLHSDFSYDPVSLRQFGRDPHRFPTEWNRFRLDAITGIVKTIRAALPPEHRQILSASLISDAQKALTRAFQDGARWTADGLVDWGVPMIYGQGTRFSTDLKNFSNRLGGSDTARRLIAGINGAHAVETLQGQLEEIRATGCRGFAFFAYTYLFENHRLTAKGEALRRAFT